MSLLKRIEQGQGKTASPSTGEEETTGRLSSLQARRVAPPGGNAQRDTYLDLKSRVQNRLLLELDPSMDISKIGEVRATI